MALQYRTKVFVYKKKDRGEADRIYTCFSEDFGKLDIFAKAIRKINSKLKSGIDIFYLSHIEFVQGKKKTLTDAILINKFREISKTPEKFIIAKKIAKILEAFIHGQEHDKEIFNLITETFRRLNAVIPDLIGNPGLSAHSLDSRFRGNDTNTNKLQLLFLYFLWNFFRILGYAPQLSNCTRCHNKLDEKKLYFSNKDGGVICQNCLPEQAGNKNYTIKINSDIIKILRIIIKNDWDILSKLKIDIETQKELNNISKNYYLYLLSSHSFKK